MAMTILLIIGFMGIVMWLFKNARSNRLLILLLSVWTAWLGILLLYTLFGALDNCGSKFNPQTGCAAVLPKQLIGLQAVVIIMVFIVSAYTLGAFLRNKLRRSGTNVTSKKR